MTIQLLAGLACILATLLQLAVYRSPDIVDSYLRRMARRIVMAALMIGAVYAFTACVSSVAPSPVFLALLLVAMGQSLFAVADLLPHFEKEHPKWTSRLNSSP